MSCACAQLYRGGCGLHIQARMSDDFGAGLIVWRHHFQINTKHNQKLIGVFFIYSRVMMRAKWILNLYKFVSLAPHHAVFIIRQHWGANSDTQRRFVNIERIYTLRLHIDFPHPPTTPTPSIYHRNHIESK